MCGLESFAIQLRKVEYALSVKNLKPGGRKAWSRWSKSSGEKVKYEKRDRKLGMDRRITRRDFLNGFGIAVGGGFVLGNHEWLNSFGLPQSPFAPEKSPNYYPPTLTGMRGSTNAVMEAGHALRDGQT